MGSLGAEKALSEGLCSALGCTSMSHLLDVAHDLEEPEPAQTRVGGNIAALKKQLCVRSTAEWSFSQFRSGGGTTGLIVPHAGGGDNTTS